MNAHAGVSGGGTALPYVDATTIRDHVDMLHDLAARAGVEGVLVLCSYGEDPVTGQKLSARIGHFAIGDIDGMATAAIDMAAEPHRNVYAPWAILRADLPPVSRGKKEDIRAVLALVADLDADHGRGEVSLPQAPPYMIETSAGNFQPVYPLARALTAQEAGPVARALASCCGYDPATKDVAHVWRVAGTLNWPNAAKLGRGRPPAPQLVRVAAPWSGALVDSDTLMKGCRGAPEMERDQPDDEGLDAGIGAVGRASDAEKSAIIAELRRRENALVRGEWVRLALAVKCACGDTEEAREAWLDFSAGWPGQAPGEPERVWATGRPDGSVSIGTALHLLRAQRPRGAEPRGASMEDPALLRAQAAGYTGLVTADAFIARMRPPSYLLDGVLQRGMLYTLTGQTGHGKTTAALLLAACIVTGEPFCGRDVRKGSVLFHAGENPDNVRTQWFALCADLGIPPGIEGMFWHEGSFGLAGAAERLMADAAVIPDLKLVVADTLQAFFYGDDDNANTEMLAAARDFRTLTQLPSRPMVLVPAHPTKGARKDGLVPRGGSAFLNEIDGNLAIWTEEGIANLHTQGKHRGADFEPIKVEMVRTEPPGLVDEKGRPMPATVARPLLPLRAEEISRHAERNEDRALSAIASNSLITQRALADALGVRPSAAHRLIVKLRDRFRWIKREGRGHVLTRDGKAALAKSRGA